MKILAILLLFSEKTAYSYRQTDLTGCHNDNNRTKALPSVSSVQRHIMMTAEEELFLFFLFLLITNALLARVVQRHLETEGGFNLFSKSLGGK